MSKKKDNYIPPSVENAIKTIKEFCDNNICIDCPMCDCLTGICKFNLAPTHWEI